MSANVIVSNVRPTKLQTPSRQALNPVTIFTEVEAQPPLMRQQASKAYVGKTVNWPVIFANASEQPSGQAHLIFRFDEHNVRMIVGEVPLTQYPQLRSLRSGERLRVRGTIRKIDVLFIELEIQELLLPRVRVCSVV